MNFFRTTDTTDTTDTTIWKSGFNRSTSCHQQCCHKRIQVEREFQWVGGGGVAWIFLSLFLFFYLEIVADKTVNIGDNIVTALRQLNGSETLLFYSIFKTTNVNPH